MARCGCGGTCNCTIAAGPGIIIDGNGSSAAPYVVTADVKCEDVRPCFSAGPGVEYDPATGVIGADLSEEAGNNIAIGPDGGLFVPTGAATVTTGCGLTGDGSASAPVAAAVGSWPYPCPPETSGGVVVCDANGVLRSEPRGQVHAFSFFEQRDYPDRLVPSAQNTIVDEATFTVTNPDPCRGALVYTFRELDCYMDLPPGASGGFGFENDETFHMRNTGTSPIVDFHAQATKVLAGGNLLGPGQPWPIRIPVTFGRGTGGATYNQVQWFLRVLMISL